jgi:glycosyltransferase involved in cell wall biosynthesis
MITAAECLSQSHDVTVFWDDKNDLDKIAQRFSLDLKKVKVDANIFSSNVSLPKRFLATRKYDAIIILIDGSIPLVASSKLFIHIQQPLRIDHNSSLRNRLKLSRVQEVFYNSEFTKVFNKKNFVGVKSSVIYPPVNINYKKKAKDNVIVTVGRFRVVNVKNEDYKKQQMMVDTFKSMVDKGLKNWKFVVATSINNENDVKFKAMLESAEGYPVEFLVNKTNKELWDTYNSAKIYWHASGFGEDLENHPEYAEHFGISTVEAMGAGVVPVVINAGGQKEIIENGQTGYLWDDVNDLTEYTKRLIDDEDLLKKISSSARIRANDFSKEKFCQKLESLLK